MNMVEWTLLTNIPYSIHLKKNQFKYNLEYDFVLLKEHFQKKRNYWWIAFICIWNHFVLNEISFGHTLDESIKYGKRKKKQKIEIHHEPTTIHSIWLIWNLLWHCKRKCSHVENSWNWNNMNLSNVLNKYFPSNFLMLFDWIHILKVIFLIK